MGYGALAFGMLAATVNGSRHAPYAPLETCQHSCAGLTCPPGWLVRQGSDCACKCGLESGRVGDMRQKTIWMFWDQGEDDLRADNTTEHSLSHHCVEAWRKLNKPLGWKVELLDAKRASELSPAYRSLTHRLQELQLQVDVLRLDLLTRYGGVWADVNVCPVRPLDTWLTDAIAPSGFFTYWLFHKDMGRDDACHTERGMEGGYFSRTSVTWFLAATAPRDPLLQLWLDTLTTHLDQLEPGTPHTQFISQCLLTQLYKANTYVQGRLDKMPKRLPTGEADDPLLKGISFAESDTQVDGNKEMYKALGKTNISKEQYDMYIQEVYPREQQQASGVFDSEANPADHDRLFGASPLIKPYGAKVTYSSSAMSRS